MSDTKRVEEQLGALRSHLAARRTAILEAWQKAVQTDSELTTADALPRKQFYDHIPDLLDGFATKLRSTQETEASKAEQKQDAATHGLLRWQQGYHLREVTREWGRLQMCLVDELSQYAAAHHPDLEPAVMSIAWRALAELCAEGVRESTAEYFQLQQTEAAGHVKDLEQALEKLRQLERERGELWQQAAHDLRGNLSVVRNATSGLTRQDIPSTMRDNFLRLVQRNVTSLHLLLEDMTDLARLRAGHEELRIASFDAAPLLTELCESLRGVALERGLSLKADGPASLPVEGDAIKTRRIAQNLLLNALKYTQQGGVTVTWGDSRADDPQRWMMSIEDTGPGYHAGPGAPFAAAIEEATEESRQVQQTTNPETTGSNVTAKRTVTVEMVPDGRPVHQEQGEGIGLSIVKRLCELLDAALEIESSPGRGTVFRVILPRKQDPAAVGP